MTNHEVSGDGQVAFLLAQVGAHAAARFAERLSPLGLTPAQAGLLRAVAREPGSSQRALAARLGLAPSRLVILIDQLQSRGLLERRRAPGDRRHHEVHLTTRGVDTLRDIGQVARAHGSDFLAALSAQDRSALGQTLRALAEHHGLTPGVHPGYRSMG